MPVRVYRVKELELVAVCAVLLLRRTGISLSAVTFFSTNVNETDQWRETSAVARRRKSADLEDATRKNSSGFESGDNY